MENRGRLPNPAAEKRQEKSEEKLGGAVMGILWIFVAVRRIAIVTVIALPILWLLHKPLWIALVIGVVVYIIWRIIWRAFWKFIHWSQK